VNKFFVSTKTRGLMMCVIPSIHSIVVVLFFVVNAIGCEPSRCQLVQDEIAASWVDKTCPSVAVCTQLVQEQLVQICPDDYDQKNTKQQGIVEALTKKMRDCAYPYLTSSQLQYGDLMCTNEAQPDLMVAVDSAARIERPTALISFNQSNALWFNARREVAFMQRCLSGCADTNCVAALTKLIEEKQALDESLEDLPAFSGSKPCLGAQEPWLMCSQEVFFFSWCLFC
jgi:hypothetical protein